MVKQRSHLPKFVPPSLEVGFDGEEELVNEDAFKGGDVVLLIEHQHSLLIVNGIYGAERNGAVAIGNQNAVADDAGRALVAISESLNIAEENQGEEGFLEDVLLAVDEAHGVFQRFAYLKLIVKRGIVGAGDTNAPMADVSLNA